MFVPFFREEAEAFAWRVATGKTRQFRQWRRNWQISRTDVDDVTYMPPWIYLCCMLSGALCRSRGTICTCQCTGRDMGKKHCLLSQA